MGDSTLCLLTMSGEKICLKCSLSHGEGLAHKKPHTQPIQAEAKGFSKGKQLATDLGGGRWAAEMVFVSHRCLMVSRLWLEQSQRVPRAPPPGPAQPSLLTWGGGTQARSHQEPRALPPQLLPLCNSTDQ